MESFGCHFLILFMSPYLNYFTNIICKPLEAYESFPRLLQVVGQYIKQFEAGNIYRKLYHLLSWGGQFSSLTSPNQIPNPNLILDLNPYPIHNFPLPILILLMTLTKLLLKILIPSLIPSPILFLLLKTNATIGTLFKAQLIIQTKAIKCKTKDIKMIQHREQRTML